MTLAQIEEYIVRERPKYCYLGSHRMDEMMRSMELKCPMKIDSLSFAQGLKYTYAGCEVYQVFSNPQHVGFSAELQSR